MLHMKGEGNLKAFQKKCVGQYCQGMVTAYMAPTSQPTTADATPQSQENAMAALMAGAKQQSTQLTGRKRQSQVQPEVTSAPTLLRAGQGTAGTGLGGSGVGHKCNACANAGHGWVQLTQAHRLTCPLFIANAEKRAAAKKAKKG